jgi:hypothetical protein
MLKRGGHPGSTLLLSLLACCGTKVQIPARGGPPGSTQVLSLLLNLLACWYKITNTDARRPPGSTQVLSLLASCGTNVQILTRGVAPGGLRSAFRRRRARAWQPRPAAAHRSVYLLYWYKSTNADSKGSCLFLLQQRQYRVSICTFVPVKRALCRYLLQQRQYRLAHAGRHVAGFAERLRDVAAADFQARYQLCCLLRRPSARAEHALQRRELAL